MRGARSPRLSLSASVGTLYSDANKRLVYDSLGAIPTPQDYPFERSI